MPELTHFDAAGDAHMVDVGGKQETKRIAIARGSIRMLPETFALIRDGNAKKGDVIGVARIAAIQGAKAHGRSDSAVSSARADTREGGLRTRRRDARRALHRAGGNARAEPGSRWKRSPPCRSGC